MDRLIAAFRRGTANEDLVKRLHLDEVNTFGLRGSRGKRPNPVTRTVTMDTPLFRRVLRDIQRSELAGRRIGHGWDVSSANIMRKSVADDSSLTHEDLKGMNDICTKWCTRTLFPDAHTRVNLLSNIVSTYNAAKKVADDLDFDLVFKGGIIMRLLTMEFLDNFPLHDRVAVERYLHSENALSVSDFDFEIVPHVSSKHAALRLLAFEFAVLMWLREKLDGYSRRRVANEFFDVSWGSSELHTLKDMLQGHVDRNEKGVLHKATIDHVVRGCHDPQPPHGYRTKTGRATPSKRDNVVLFRAKASPDAERSVMSACDFFTEMGVPGVPCDYPRDFYCTLNTFIGEGTERKVPTQRLSTFHLCRIKQGFIVYLTTRTGEKLCERLGGEVIDLSQSAGTDVDEIRRYVYDHVQQPYRMYYVIGSDLSIRSYSANGLVHDLRMQIHGQDAPAFEALAAGGKIRKRMLRYVVFVAVYVMGPYCEHSAGRKLRAMVALVDATSSVERFAAQRRCGVAAIDEFVKWEQRSLAIHGPISKKKQYLAVLHRHLKGVAALLSGTPKRTPVFDSRYLEFSDTFLFPPV